METNYHQLHTEHRERNTQIPTLSNLWSAKCPPIIMFSMPGTTSRTPGDIRGVSRIFLLCWT